MFLAKVKMGRDNIDTLCVDFLDMFDALHTWELSLLESLQHIRSPALDSFFVRLNFFDNDAFYFIVLIVVWSCFGKRWGMRLLSLVLLSGLINNYAKDFFEEPRPSHIMPALALIKNSSFGFPSGAAQTHIILAGFGMIAFPTLIPVLCFLAFFLLVSFSRIYLGAHFISDVVGGWIIGGLILYCYILFHDKIERWVEGLSSKKALLASFLVPLLILLPYINPKTIIITCLLFGVNFGLWLGAFVSGAAAAPLSGAVKKVLYIVLAAFVFFICGANIIAAIKTHANPHLANGLVGVVYAFIGICLSWGIQRVLSGKTA